MNEIFKGKLYTIFSIRKTMLKVLCCSKSRKSQENNKNTIQICEKFKTEYSKHSATVTKINDKSWNKRSLNHQNHVY